MSDTELAPRGSAVRTVETLGIVFGFDFRTSLDTLADNAEEVNTNYDCKQFLTWFAYSITD
jgi:hypothetical protein